MGRISVVLAFALLLALPATAFADGPKDQIVLSGNVLVGPAQTVRTVVAFDGRVTVRGRVTQDVVAFNGDVVVAGGHVNGDVTAFNGRVFLGPRTVVGGDLNWSGDRPVLAPGARVLGDTNEFNWNGSPFSGFAFALLFWIAETVSTIVLGIVLIALFPRGFDATVEAERSSPGLGLGWGLVVLVILPIAVIAALISLVGIPLGVGLLLALIPIGAVGYVVGAFVLGRMILSGGSRMLAFLLGAVIVQVLALVPFLNIIVAIAATAIGLGAMLVAAWRANRPQRPVAPPAVPAA